MMDKLLVNTKEVKLLASKIARDVFSEGTYNGPGGLNGLLSISKDEKIDCCPIDAIDTSVSAKITSNTVDSGGRLMSIVQDETKEIDIDPNLTMIARDLVEEKPSRCHTSEKSQIPWYSRMAPIEAAFGVKSFNKGDKYEIADPQ